MNGATPENFGAPVVAGTDSAFPYPSTSVVHFCRLASHLQNPSLLAALSSVFLVVAHFLAQNP